MIFAAFVLAPVGTGYAATTRAADRGETGIGLPGGKLDAGEDPLDAVIREAAEEGWAVVGLDPVPIHAQSVQGRPVVWFRATGATALRTYKEQHRISTLVATRDQVLASGYGNKNLPI